MKRNLIVVGGLANEDLALLAGKNGVLEGLTGKE